MGKGRITGSNRGRRISLKQDEFWLIEIACKYIQGDLRQLMTGNANNDIGTTATYYIRLYRDLLVKIVNLPPETKRKRTG